MMLTALVLICSIINTPDIRDCNRYNATVMMRVPAEFANPVTCLLHGQAYIAGTSIGQELGETDRVEVICAPTQTVQAVPPLLAGGIATRPPLRGKLRRSRITRWRRLRAPSAASVR
jgi:hypothetical protein